MSDGLDLLILLAHGTSAPAFAAHAFHLAAAGASLGRAVGLYLAVEGTTWLSEEAPRDPAEQLEELRELGVLVYACPNSLTQHGITPGVDACTLLGATAVRLLHRATTVVSL